MPHVLIIGSGIAGPVAAMALIRAGCTVAVYDKHATSTPSGSWLMFQPNGMDALRSIDALDCIQDLGFAVDCLSFVNGAGKPLGRLPLSAPRADGLRSRLLRRSDLYTALAEEARSRGADITFGKELVGLSHPQTPTQDPGVTAHFADGSSAHGDLLVGADGIHSRVRSIIDPDAKPRRVPILNVDGYAPRAPTNPSQEVGEVGFGEEGVMTMQFGTHAFFGWAPSPSGIVWFANPPSPSGPGVLRSITDSEWRARLRELHGSDAGPIPAVIDGTPHALTAWATYDLPTVRRWHNRRDVVIIGDAAHAAAPSSGQGASMALEDAVILGKCVRDCTQGITVALETFERLRRDRVERVVRHGAAGAQSKSLGPVGRWFRDLLMPWFVWWMARDEGRGMSWLQGHHIDWDEVVEP